MTKFVWVRASALLARPNRPTNVIPIEVDVGGNFYTLDTHILMTIIPATTASGAVTIYDGSTAIATIPAAAALGQSAPYRVQLGIRATNASTGFKITTGASVSCIAVGKFSS